MVLVQGNVGGRTCVLNGVFIKGIKEKVTSRKSSVLYLNIEIKIRRQGGYLE